MGYIITYKERCEHGWKLHEGCWPSVEECIRLNELDKKKFEILRVETEEESFRMTERDRAIEHLAPILKNRTVSIIDNAYKHAIETGSQIKNFWIDEEGNPNFRFEWFCGIGETYKVESDDTLIKVE